MKSPSKLIVVVAVAVFAAIMGCDKSAPGGGTGRLAAQDRKT